MKELQISSRKIAQVIAHKMVRKCLEASDCKAKMTPSAFASTIGEIRSYPEIMGALTCKDDLLLLGKFANSLNELLGNYLDNKLSQEDFIDRLTVTDSDMHKAIFEIKGGEK